MFQKPDNEESKKVTMESVPEQYFNESPKSHNFRQQIRSLREESDNSSLLASSEELSDVDNDGFIVFSRNKRGRKSKTVTNEDCHENLKLDCDQKTKSEKSNLIKSVDNIQNSTQVRVSDHEQMRSSPLRTAEESSQSDIAKSSVFVNALETVNISNQSKSTSNLVVANDSKKSVWGSTATALSNREFDISECPICFQPWLNDKVILEECGHSFHSECIRTWMKRKNTCPFCAGFSLLPDEFPHLT